MTIALRDAYGQALLRHGGANPDVVVLDADVSASSKSCFFAAEHPDRFFNVGIAESNMTGMAAGFASAGKIPFANTFAIFFSTLGLCAARGLICYTNLNAKLMASYGGMSDSFDGPSHHAIEDLAIMRSLPNMTVMVPSDNALVEWMVQAAIKTYGPMYIRLTRDAVPGTKRATLLKSGRALLSATVRTRLSSPAASWWRRRWTRLIFLRKKALKSVSSTCLR